MENVEKYREKIWEKIKDVRDRDKGRVSFPILKLENLYSKLDVSILA